MHLKPTEYICPLCNKEIVLAQIHVKSTITVNKENRYNIECPKCQGSFQSDLKLEQGRMADSKANLFKPLAHGQRFFMQESNYQSRTIVSKYTVDPDWKDYDLNPIQNLEDNIKYLKTINEDEKQNDAILAQEILLSDLKTKREEAKQRLIERGELNVNDL